MHSKQRVEADMGFVDREAIEPDERPTELGRHLWQTCHVEHPGEWREVFETESRQRAVMIEGCLIGRGQGRIAPITDVSGWDARVIERLDDKQNVIYVVRVKFTPPKAKDAKADEVFDRLRKGEQEPEAIRAGKPTQETLAG
jgi:hypothetical protein